MSDQVERLARWLHEQYLEAVKPLQKGQYNQSAAVSYDDLPEASKSIDRYIAEKLIQEFNVSFDND